MTLLTTIGEGIWLLLGMVLYQKNWNIGWTLISYLFPFYFIYLYYLFLKGLKILD
ncbi:hypothetical protein [Ureibacillus chungkukjangi]|uniref:hypothetical protein n=1 Tax=Ureibacillus chungkukjangi TaxID=1202712 RepID=UPI002040DB4B|nr:hypothetical protein [Ureibacillus chungkukjangi]